jgi:hypothetical protein
MFLPPHGGEQKSRRPKATALVVPGYEAGLHSQRGLLSLDARQAPTMSTDMLTTTVPDPDVIPDMDRRRPKAQLGHD